MLCNKSRQILVLAILLVFLAFFTGYCLMGHSDGRPPGFLIWIEETLSGYYRPVILESGGTPPPDHMPEIPNGP